MSEDRHNPLPHIALSAIALKSVYEKAASLATHLATELRELQAPGGREWQCSVPPWPASRRGGISRSVLSRKGSCQPDKIVTGLRAARPADNAYKTGDSRRVSVCWPVRCGGTAPIGAGGGRLEAWLRPTSGLERRPSSEPSCQVPWALAADAGTWPPGQAGRRESRAGPAGASQTVRRLPARTGRHT